MPLRGPKIDHRPAHSRGDDGESATWFGRLTGCDENEWRQGRLAAAEPGSSSPSADQIMLGEIAEGENQQLTMPDGRSYQVGRFSTPTLSTLRSRSYGFPKQSNPVTAMLVAARLGQHEEALRAAGVVQPDDLQDMDDEMLAGAGLSKLEVSRFRRKVNDGDIMTVTHVQRLVAENVRGDVADMHSEPGNQHATFQVASQFNCLEFVGPQVTPEQGVSRYADDRTQGPACSLACGAATIFRNYYVPIAADRTAIDSAVDDREVVQLGQSVDLQIENLASVQQSLEQTRWSTQDEHQQQKGASDGWKDVDAADPYFHVQGGYTLTSGPEAMGRLAKILQFSEEEKDGLRAQLCIGVQSDTEVTARNWGRELTNSPEQLVTQVFGSACSLQNNFDTSTKEEWQPFASLVLEASYEATLLAAAANAAKHGWEAGSSQVYLTLLGGGAFGNDEEWIVSAIRRACRVVEHLPLRVKIVTFAGEYSPQLLDLAVEFSAGSAVAAEPDGEVAALREQLAQRDMQIKLLKETAQDFGILDKGWTSLPSIQELRNESTLVLQQKFRMSNASRATLQRLHEVPEAQWPFTAVSERSADSQSSSRGSFLVRLLERPYTCPAVLNLELAQDAFPNDAGRRKLVQVLNANTSQELTLGVTGITASTPRSVTTAYNLAAMTNDIELLQQLTVEVTSPGNKLGITPLHVAAMFNHGLIADKMIELGLRDKLSGEWLYATTTGITGYIPADNSQSEIDKAVIKEYGGWSALLVAVANGHIELVHQLLMAGANHCESDAGGVQSGYGITEARTHYGLGTLVVAMQCDRLDVAELLLSEAEWCVRLNKIPTTGESTTWAYVNGVDNDGLTALHFSVGQNLEFMTLLLARGANVNAQTTAVDHRDTALMMSAQVDDCAAGRMLLDHGADVHIAGAGGRTALSDACQFGHVSFVQMLLAQTLPQKVATANQLLYIDVTLAVSDDDGMLALDRAVPLPNDEVLTVLRKHGGGYIPGELRLAVCSCTGDDTASITAALSAGCAPSAAWEAIEKGCTKTMGWNPLCSANCERMPGKAMMPPLSIAASLGLVAATKLLIGAGADIDCAMTFRKRFDDTVSLAADSPEDAGLRLTAFATQDLSQDVGLRLRAHETSSDEAKADLSPSDLLMPENSTPLMYAVANNQFDVAVVLIGAGANIEATARDGTTALMVAATHDKPQMIELLLGHDVLLNQATRFAAISLSMLETLRPQGLPTNWFEFVEGWTPASYYGCAAESLVAWSDHERWTEHQCDVNAINDDGYSAMILAAKRCNVRVVATLLFYEASEICWFNGQDFMYDNSAVDKLTSMKQMAENSSIRSWTSRKDARPSSLTEAFTVQRSTVVNMFARELHKVEANAGGACSFALKRLVVVDEIANVQNSVLSANCARCEKPIKKKKNCFGCGQLVCDSCSPDRVELTTGQPLARVCSGCPNDEAEQLRLNQLHDQLRTEQGAALTIVQDRLRGKGATAYALEHAMLDESSATCMRCQSEFGKLFNKSHHCLQCGDLVCDKCSQLRLVLTDEDIASSGNWQLNRIAVERCSNESWGVRLRKSDCSIEGFAEVADADGQRGPIERAGLVAPGNCFPFVIPKTELDATGTNVTKFDRIVQVKGVAVQNFKQLQVELSKLEPDCSVQFGIETWVLDDGLTVIRDYSGARTNDAAASFSSGGGSGRLGSLVSPRSKAVLSRVCNPCPRGESEAQRKVLTVLENFRLSKLSYVEVVAGIQAEMDKAAVELRGDIALRRGFDDVETHCQGLIAAAQQTLAIGIDFSQQNDFDKAVASIEKSLDAVKTLPSLQPMQLLHAVEPAESFSNLALADCGDAHRQRCYCELAACHDANSSLPDALEFADMAIHINPTAAHEGKLLKAKLLIKAAKTGAVVARMHSLKDAKTWQKSARKLKGEEWHAVSVQQLSQATDLCEQLLHEFDSEVPKLVRQQALAEIKILRLAQNLAETLVLRQKRDAPSLPKSTRRQVSLFEELLAGQDDAYQTLSSVLDTAVVDVFQRFDQCQTQLKTAYEQLAAKHVPELGRNGLSSGDKKVIQSRDLGRQEATGMLQALEEAADKLHHRQSFVAKTLRNSAFKQFSLKLPQPSRFDSAEPSRIGIQIVDQWKSLIDPVSCQSSTDNSITAVQEQFAAGKDLTQALSNAGSNLIVERKFWKTRPEDILPKDKVQECSSAVFLAFSQEDAEISRLLKQFADARSTIFRIVSLPTKPSDVERLTALDDNLDELSEELGDLTADKNKMANKVRKKKAKPEDLEEVTQQVEAKTLEVMIASKAVEREKRSLVRLATKHFPEMPMEMPEVFFELPHDLFQFDEMNGLEKPGVFFETFSAPSFAAEKAKVTTGRHDVYIASISGEDCVLKEYSMGDQKEMKQLRKEAAVMTRLSHPNVAEVWSIIRSKDDVLKVYVHMPYYSGGELKNWLTKHGPSMEQKRRVIREIFEGVSYLHENGVIHSDLKLENIFMSDDTINARPIIGDFDVSKDNDGRTQTKTSTTAVQGTKAYMAPEMGRTKASPASDMYAVGVLCFLACFPALEEELVATLEKSDHSPGAFGSDASAQLAALIQRCVYNADMHDHLQSLLLALVAQDPEHRPKAQDALEHPFVNSKAAFSAHEAELVAAKKRKVQAIYSRLRKKGIRPQVSMSLIAAVEEVADADCLPRDKLMLALGSAHRKADTLLREKPDPRGLTRDEIAAIHLYTQDNGFNSVAFYRKLNAALRSNDAALIMPYRGFVALLSQALFKLPTNEYKVIYRGIKDLSAQQIDRFMELKQSQEPDLWDGFGSTSNDLSTTEFFLGQKGKRVIFTIEGGNSARDVRKYSWLPKEDELLMPCCTAFVIKSMLKQDSGDMLLVTVEQTDMLSQDLQLIPIEQLNIGGGSGGAPGSPHKKSGPGLSGPGKSSKATTIKAPPTGTVNTQLSTVGASVLDVKTQVEAELPAQILVAAWKLHEQGEFAEALQVFMQAILGSLELQPHLQQHYLAKSYQGKRACYTELGQHKEALEMAKQAVEAVSDNAEYLFERGEVHLNLEQYMMAVADYESAITKNPTADLETTIKAALQKVHGLTQRQQLEDLLEEKEVHDLHAAKQASLDDLQTFYHGTALDAGLEIQRNGFRVDLSGSNAGTMLGNGIYLTTTLEKALNYATGEYFQKGGNPAGGCVLHLKVDLGRCKNIELGETDGRKRQMRLNWHRAENGGYDSAYSHGCKCKIKCHLGGKRCTTAMGIREEHCVRDTSRVQVVDVTLVRTGEADSAGYSVHGGRMVFDADKVPPPELAAHIQNYQAGAMLKLTRAMFDQKQWAEALAILAQAAALATDTELIGECLLGRSACYNQLGQHIKALEAAEQALVAVPDTASGWFAHGLALAGLGRYVPAAGSYQKALALDPPAGLAATISNAKKRADALHEEENFMHFKCGGKTILLKLDCSLDDLLAKLALIHEVPKDSISLSYADEDGDEIDIADDSDLNDAKKLAQEGKLELNYSSGNN